MSRVAGLLLLLAVAMPAQACRCDTSPSFEAVSKDAPVLVQARVLEYDQRSSSGHPLAMLLEVTKPIRNARAGERIRVWGDNGMLCRPYVTLFPVGSEWVFALGSDPMPPPSQAEANVRDLSISVCGKHWRKP